MGAWLAVILANQAWRAVLARAYRRAQPGVADAARWGAYWTVGATIAGALWGAAAVAMFPASAPYQALFIVCQFSVILGGLSLTAVYRPSFYGFVLAVLLPLSSCASRSRATARISSRRWCSSSCWDSCSHSGAR